MLNNITKKQQEKEQSLEYCLTTFILFSGGVHSTMGEVHIINLLYKRRPLTDSEWKFMCLVPLYLSSKLPHNVLLSYYTDHFGSSVVEQPPRE